MKTITNWRYYVMALLFTIGSLCITLAFGEDMRPMKEWLIVHLGLLVVGYSFLFLLNKCIKHWSDKGKIPDLDKYLK